MAGHHTHTHIQARAYTEILHTHTYTHTHDCTLFLKKYVHVYAHERALSSIVIRRSLVVPALMTLLLAVMIVLAAELVHGARTLPRR